MHVRFIWKIQGPLVYGTPGIQVGSTFPIFPTVLFASYFFSKKPYYPYFFALKQFLWSKISKKLTLLAQIFYSQLIIFLHDELQFRRKFFYSAAKSLNLQFSLPQFVFFNIEGTDICFRITVYNDHNNKRIPTVYIKNPYFLKILSLALSLLVLLRALESLDHMAT